MGNNNIDPSDPDVTSGANVKNFDEPFVAPESPTSLKPAKFGKVLILNRVFAALVDMTQALQQVAATQAERLDFLSKWQQAYTDEMNQVHVFAANNGDTVDDPSDTAIGNFRSDMNQQNSTYTEEMRSNREIVSDDAKGLQSYVNQSNDAVQQQTNMATAIIQEFSTILAALYR